MTSIVLGTAANDTLNGSAASDIIQGYAGNDLIISGDGNDVLSGGDGQDNLKGGLGADVHDGGAGNDWANYFWTTNGVLSTEGVTATARRHDTGNTGSNILDGGEGNDVLTAATATTRSWRRRHRCGGVRRQARNYSVCDSAAAETVTLADQRAGSPDGIDAVTGVEVFQFADGPIAARRTSTALPPTPA